MENRKITKEESIEADSSIRHRERIATDSLGFNLKVDIIIGDLQSRGRHKTYIDEQGQTDDTTPHRVELRYGLSDSELVEVVAHEAYHLFYSIRSRITVDEETEAEVFGHLVKRLYEVAQMPKIMKENKL